MNNIFPVGVILHFNFDFGEVTTVFISSWLCVAVGLSYSSQLHSNLLTSTAVILTGTVTIVYFKCPATN